MISVEQAFDLIEETIVRLETETIPLEECVGRVLATSIEADVDSPPHRKSVMDGFAVRSDDINAGTLKLEVVETIIAGGVPTKVISDGQAARIMTGAPMPDGADSVVMVEMTEFDEAAGSVVINVESIQPAQHAMELGQNFRRGQKIFSSGHRVRAIDVGLLAEVGAANCLVFQRPSAAVLPTGNELVPSDSQPGEGQIRNSNGPMLMAMLGQQQLAVTDLGIGIDQEERLHRLMEAGLEHDLLLLSGGVSAGTMDLVPGILKKLGVVEVFHKVMVKPGKPIYFGMLNRDGRRRYVFGLPGNPVSSLVGFRLFVSRAIAMLTGQSSLYGLPVKAVLTSDHGARGNRPTYWPGRLIEVAGSNVPCDATRRVEPLTWNGSSDLLALGTANGLIAFPPGTQMHSAGSEFDFYPL